MKRKRCMPDGEIPSMLEKIKSHLKMKYPESRLATKYLDGLSGLEIGGSAYNPFGLDTKNVDYSAALDTIYKQEEMKNCGEAMPVDIVAPGDDLPVPDESQDFVVSSHVLEHFYDPIKALQEWHRVIRPGGYIFMIVPHKERIFDRTRPRTTLDEIIKRHESKHNPGTDGHFSVWITEDLVELIDYLGWTIVEAHDVDDKVGNGFTIVIQKTRENITHHAVRIFKPALIWRTTNRLNIIARKLLSAL